MAQAVCFDEILACGGRTEKATTGIAALAASLWPRGRARKRVHVDLRDLPDHLKRDIGLLDGREPQGGVCW